MMTKNPNYWLPRNDNDNDDDNGGVIVIISLII